MSLDVPTGKPESIGCPHCRRHFLGLWNVQSIGSEDAGRTKWSIQSVQCLGCGKWIIALYELTVGFGLSHSVRYVLPQASSRPPLPPEVPPEFATDYREACDVLPVSQKASAALSRRCLQHLLREKGGVKSGDLVNEIQQVLDSKQLPSFIAGDLDAIRHVGNFAVHPMKSTTTGLVVDVEPQEAEWLLNVLENLFDFYFVQPTKAQAKRDALNAKLADLNKPPLKKP